MIRILFLLVCIMVFGCQKGEYDPQAAENPQLLHDSFKRLSDVIVYDIFSPPVASRNYAYPSIAAYQALLPDHPKHRSFVGYLTDLEPFPQPDTTQEYCLPLSSLHAFLVVSKALIFSEPKIQEKINEIHHYYDSIGVSKKIMDRSIGYGDKVAAHVLAWANEDNYKQTRTFPKFEITNEPARWTPTPPDYMDGIEPHWSKIRPLVIDSATQFVPPTPTAFDLSESSQFYKEMIEVYEIGNNLTDEQINIAKHWDCNPYVSHHKGHVMFATKKITPGGHWMGIASIAAKQANDDLISTAKTFALTSIALFDAFISCWDEKYRSNLIRPETVINQHVDEDWLPLLQTPPFPEYTSGHSVISTAAATVLTNIYGNEFNFRDDVELEFGLPVRNFSSFQEASQEAAISRLYGGIHYMPAIEKGVEQGKAVGNFLTQELSDLF